MAFGKIYTKEKNPRTTAILAVAKANGLDLETVEVDTNAPTPEYLKLNALGKVPTFEGQDGYVLHECMAIAIYRKSYCRHFLASALHPPGILPRLACERAAGSAILPMMTEILSNSYP